MSYERGYIVLGGPGKLLETWSFPALPITSPKVKFPGRDWSIHRSRGDSGESPPGHHRPRHRKHGAGDMHAGKGDGDGSAMDSKGLRRHFAFPLPARRPHGGTSPPFMHFMEKFVMGWGVGCGQSVVNKKYCLIKCSSDRESIVVRVLCTFNDECP